MVHARVPHPRVVVGALGCGNIRVSMRRWCGELHWSSIVEATQIQSLGDGRAVRINPVGTKVSPIAHS
jgi:hypothetical protein